MILVILLLASMAVPAAARPGRGFNHGPYLVIESGATEVAFDRDQTTGLGAGSDFEPFIGFLFGWNVLDWLSAELQGSYSTNKNDGRREHIALANLYAKGFLVTDLLTDFPTLRILPFVKAGMSIRASVLPGSPNAAETGKVTSLGFGPSVGAGIAFRWKKYFYFGIDVQEDFLFLDDHRQTVGGVPDTLVYKGGFYPSFVGAGFLGVHY